MRKKLLALALATSFALTAGAWTRAQQKDEAGVRAAINHYFLGHSTGDGNHFRAAFHPDAKLFFMREGKFASLTLEEYASRASGKPPADEAERKRSIEAIDITGNAAVAKIILDYPTVRFVDYMSLLKIGEEWRIVNKTFYSDPKAK